MDMSLERAERILELLHGEIWTGDRAAHLKVGACIQPGPNFVNPDSIRGLTKKEVDLVFGLAEEYGFPATISDRFGGASFCIKFFSPEQTDRVGRAQRLITIESSQFPGNDGRTEDDEVYELMSSWANSEENLALIEKFKIKKPAKYSEARW